MSHIVTLPSGATAVIRDGEDLTYGDREDIFAAAPTDSDGKLITIGGHAVNDFGRILMRIGIEGWSYTDMVEGVTQPWPLPAQQPDVVRRLPIKDGAMLQRETAALQKEIFPDFDVSPETDSPTLP